MTYDDLKDDTWIYSGERYHTKHFVFNTRNIKCPKCRELLLYGPEEVTYDRDCSLVVKKTWFSEKEIAYYYKHKCGAAFTMILKIPMSFVGSRPTKYER